MFTTETDNRDVINAHKSMEKPCKDLYMTEE